MIVTWFLSGVYLLLNGVFYVIPSLPEMPTQIITALGWVSTIIVNGVGFMKYMITASMFNALVTISILVINFDLLWDAAFFIIRKIPMLGVRE